MKTLSKVSLIVSIMAVSSVSAKDSAKYLTYGPGSMKCSEITQLIQDDEGTGKLVMEAYVAGYASALNAAAFSRTFADFLHGADLTDTTTSIIAYCEKNPDVMGEAAILAVVGAKDAGSPTKPH
jgi:hypothetical protein